MAARTFAPTTIAVPVEHPDGGVFHVVPMGQLELKKLARRIVKMEYLTDARGKHVFNQSGHPVPKFDQDDEAVMREAMEKRCARIDEVAIPVFIGGEQQFDEIEGQRVARTVVVSAENTSAVCDGNHSELAGRCPVRVSANGKTVQCARVVVGDYTDTAASLMQSILAGGSEHEVEEEIAEKVSEPANASAEWHKQEGHICGEVSCVQKVKKTKTVQQLVAEWVIEECVKLGEGKFRDALKN